MSKSTESAPAKRRAPLSPDEMPPAGCAGESFELPARVAHYLYDVLRMQPGERVELFDGSGRVILAELLEGNGEPLRALVHDDRTRLHGESPCALTLVQALPKGKRFDMILEKATELGVARIIALETQRTVVRISADKVPSKLERWQRIIEAAARQCRRNVTPELSAPMNLTQAAKALQSMPNFVAHTAENLPSLPELLEARAASAAGAPPAVALWIGPEGGFEAGEVDTLLQSGAQAFHLGPRVLRAETAGLVGISLLQAFLGDLA